MLNKREAKREGVARGKGAASWVFDGNTATETYTRVLKGIEGGDTLIMDAYAPPAWLSGEWSGESMSELLGASSGDDDIDQEIADIYETAADDAYWVEIARVARYHTLLAHHTSAN